ncbi:MULTISPECIES: hypothetical protein [Sphingomonadaceae]|uniref:Uncharacterized protein n=1 Tax=Sphingomonas bisphenolicum TaxID=296544 RepID=A0ABN5WGL1_9SPHN|nr:MULTISPECIES: hypothetical protein [Sphingomonadaceae]MBA4091506.1 hypothetical protein [Sphingobium sp.]MBZ9650046.1 hypothetical protein [Sphingobium sp. 3R8]BBF70983.1 hypothetical protein SBA_ch1_31830 [Sphingomonas bisphenolicum]
MAEPKPLASLTSGLLARKGAAQPAMRRPMLGFGRASSAALQQDDLGWNDMGFDVEPVHEPMEEPAAPIGLTPMTPVVPVPPVVAERKVLAKRLAAKPASVQAVARNRKAAFTLRLDADRHLKLRLACAITGRSAQQIVTQALDDLLNDLPEIDRLTQQLPHMRDGQ